MEVGINNQTGQRVIDITLRRHKEGVKVNVQVAPEIEEFFRQWGGGVQEAPRYGRVWHPITADDKLLLWSFEAAIAHDEDQQYSLLHSGSALRTDIGSVNISFLRLVGASEGRSFIYEGVVSRQELEKLATKMRRAAESFYTEYIQPVNMNIYVGVRDLYRGEL